MVAPTATILPGWVSTVKSAASGPLMKTVPTDKAAVPPLVIV